MSSVLLDPRVDRIMGCPSPLISVPCIPHCLFKCPCSCDVIHILWCDVISLYIWRCPGKVPNRISFSRLPHFLIVCPKYDSCFLFLTLSNRLLFCSINHRRQGGYIFALSCSFACLSAGLRNIYVCQSVYLSVCLINFIHQAVDKYNETNTGK